MRRMRTTILFGSLVFAGVGCPLIAGVKDGVLGDGGIQPGGDAHDDAPSDLPRGDAGCAAFPDASFCDDFDHGLLGARWDGIGGGGGRPSLDDDAAVSPPHSVVVTSVTPDAPANMDVYFYKNLPGGLPRDLLCEFDVRVDSPEAPSFTAFETSTSVAGVQYLIRLWLGTSVGRVDAIYNYSDGGGSRGRYHIPTLATGPWRHVGIALSLPETGDGGVRVAFDDLQVLDVTIATPVADGGGLVMNFGARYMVVEQGFGLRFDNFVCSWGSLAAGR